MASLFDDLQLSSFDCLNENERTYCPKCNKSRKYFCYDCFQITVQDRDQVPSIALPVELVVVHHPKENRSKSTAVHAAVLSSDVQFYTFPQFPDFQEEGTWLLFPSDDAISVEDIVGPVNRIVVLDTTWQKCGVMTSHPVISKLPRIKIRTYSTTFWRYQKKPSDHLATIEAIYYFYKEYCVAQHGEYKGEYDNLLYFYTFFYQTVQQCYKHTGEPFTKIKGYIKDCD